MIEKKQISWKITDCIAISQLFHELKLISFLIRKLLFNLLMIHYYIIELIYNVPVQSIIHHIPICVTGTLIISMTIQINNITFYFSDLQFDFNTLSYYTHPWKIQAKTIHQMELNEGQIAAIVCVEKRPNLTLFFIEEKIRNTKFCCCYIFIN